MLKFISFGSGSSGNCYLLYTEQEALLIDIGIGSRALKKYFREYGLSFSCVKNILVTHDHADHVKSVGKISQMLGVPVYTTVDAHAGINRNYVVNTKIAKENTRTLVAGEPIQLGCFKVTPFEVPHDSADNVGYKIECEGIVFCLMTDIGHLTDEMRQMISEANYLVIEANYDMEMLKAGTYPEYLKTRILGPDGHLSNEECAQALVENATERLHHVWLCHLSEENNHPELARKTVEQILRSYGIVAGKDFDLDVLKRTVPTGEYLLKG